MTAETLSATINEQGRVVIPAQIRRHLGVRAGDRLLFVLDDEGSVRLVAPRLLIDAVWSNNPVVAVHTPTGHESIRELRSADAAAEQRHWDDVATQDAADDRAPEQVTADLFAALGVSRPPA